ncbi:MAG: hypothetical protein H7Z13_00890 [Ferruginibacter sp.]|nr:hypothetical protein [Ferruginibacter sp.]
MKTKNLVIAIAVASFLIGFTSCKKDDSATKAEMETTFELSTDQAVADNLTEDANDIYIEAATEQGLVGETPATPFESMGILGCASVTVTPLIGFPKTIKIDFGTGCTSGNGIFRKGIIRITLSDSLRKTGSTSVLTFDGYYVNGFKKEGIITWTNNSTATIKGWQRKVENGKITAPSGVYWLHSGIKTVVQTAGYATPRNLLDDIFSITGNSSVTNANGVTRTSTIIDPLQKKTICENITKGSIQLSGPNHTALIDFGNGDCNNIATISINGGTPRTILLR